MKKQGLILIVDDVEMNRAMLADMLMEDYSILEAANGMEAAAVLQKHHEDISLVLLDIVMPVMDGFEVMTLMNRNGWIGWIPVITISSETASAYIDHAYDLGASDYISRPFDERTVQRRVRNTIMLYSKQKMLEGMVAEQIVEKERNNFLMVEILSNIVEFRNGESGLHVLHIRTLTDIFLHKLQEITDRYPISPSRIVMIVNASALHDIGKISIPEEILNKPGRLTAEEFETMKTHSAIGAGIMEDALQRHHEELLQVAYNICRWHHERWDGRGYPDGLKEDEIPIEAQVVALADVYDALTSVRVYKAAYSHRQAMEMILDGQCGTFNPILLRCLEEAGPHLEEELRIRSLNGVSEMNIRELSRQIIAGGNISNRTLTLLEQERTKYQFFASMSNEIQLEYDLPSDLLSLSDWGAQQLGLDVVIEHPAKNEQLLRVFPQEEFKSLRRSLDRATPENPIISNTYELNVKGQKRWYKGTLRPLWEESGSGVIGRIIGKFVDVHEEHMRMQQLKLLLEQDALTGLSNAASARSLVEQALEDRKRQYAMILVDLDDFRLANEQRGHDFGDQVLQYMAGVLRRNLRGGDVASRAGGDEFVLFLEYEEGLESIIHRLSEALRQEFRGYPTTASIGIALAPRDGTEYEDLFHKAEQAMYAAKRMGKDRYCFYDDSAESMAGRRFYDDSAESMAAGVSPGDPG